MNRCVLDASAVIAYLRREPGWQPVEAVLLQTEAVISAVNYSEVVSKLAAEGLSAEDIVAALDCLRLTVASFDKEAAFDSGLLRPTTRHLGLSLGDRACIALARRLQVPAVTADRTWAALNLGVTIEVVRE